MRHNRSTRLTALAALAMLNVFTLAAAAVVAHMLPPRLARLRVPVVAGDSPVISATAVLPAAVAGPGTEESGAQLPTWSGLASLIAGSLPSAEVGPSAGVVVADSEAESQAPPTAATDTAVGVVLVTFTVLAAGVAPVVVAAKLKDVEIGRAHV